MTPTKSRLALRSLVAAVVLALPAGAAPPVPAKVEFNRDVKPILSDTCFACHGPDKNKRKADLRLDTEDGLYTVKPGHPEDSELFRRITSDEPSEQMPPVKSGRKLSERDVTILKRWIEQGAKWEKHWAYIPPVRPAAPSVSDPRWPRNPIDHFIRARLDREGVPASPEAPKTTLIRRVTLDLTGLPPTPAEVDAFLTDDSSDAYEKVVDRLLASPRYGERMVLDWLDAARYADSNGYQQDQTRTLWPWRDWVVRAMNDNMPFDQFTVEQIAGDLLPGATQSQKIATGFNRNHMLNGEGGRVAEESRIDYVVDRVDTTTSVWLGVTMACARCHDHKYDPFTQKDYYQLFAYFNNLPETGSVDRGGNAAPVLPLPTPRQKDELARLQKTLTEAESQVKAAETCLLGGLPEWEEEVRADKVLIPLSVARNILVPAEKRSEKERKDVAEFFLARYPARQVLVKQADAAKKALDAANKGVLTVMVMEERPQPRDTHVLLRGVWDKPGDKVTPATPATLTRTSKEAVPNRLGLARWLVDPGNPLTARVTVNRYWQMFFGTGLVKTAEDFGVQGEPPSHPELLDWLTMEFHRTGWDVKAMHRLIVTSATYRQSSRVTSVMRDRDPENRLLARGPRHRLSSLLLRDQALAISGLLSEKVGGAPVRPYQPPGIWEEFSFGKITYKQDVGPDLYRRSLYTFWRRSVGPTTLFDTANRQVCTVRLPRTNTPLQALILFNEQGYVEAARALAARVMREAGPLATERVSYLFRLATARLPTEAERQILLERYGKLVKHYRADNDAAMKLLSVGQSPRDPTLDVAELAACTGLASLVLNLDEVVSKE